MTQTVDYIAGEIWRCVKEDFEKQGVQLPTNWNGVGLAYGGYVRAGEIMQKALKECAEEARKEERERIGVEVNKKFRIHRELASQWTGVRLDGKHEACNPHTEQMEAYKTILDFISNISDK